MGLQYMEYVYVGAQSLTRSWQNKRNLLGYAGSHLSILKLSLLSLDLSFSITAVILADNSMLFDDSKLRGSIIKNYQKC